MNPPNAMLNYAYAVLESESRLALAALGLDPGIGVLHNDLRSRDSLACDLMEPVRPQVDAFLLDWLSYGPLKREWFFEQRDGNCRLMASLAVKLSESAEIWRRAVAPFAEGIARSLWSTKTTGKTFVTLSTPLTHSRKREARGTVVQVPQKSKRVVENNCGHPWNQHQACLQVLPKMRSDHLARKHSQGSQARSPKYSQAGSSSTASRNTEATKRGIESLESRG